MTDISKAAVDVAANVLRRRGEHYLASQLTTLRVALDEAEAERDRFLTTWAESRKRHLAAEAERDAANALLLHTAASLAAAISLLERGGKKAAASDKMFAQMLTDYRKTLDAARAHLGAKP